MIKLLLIIGKPLVVPVDNACGLQDKSGRGKNNVSEQAPQTGKTCLK